MRQKWVMYTWMSNAHKTKTHYRREVSKVSEHATEMGGVHMDEQAHSRRKHTTGGKFVWRAVVAKHNDVTCCQIHGANDFGVGIEH